MGRAYIVVTVLLASATAWAQQYKADKAGPPPPEIAAGMAQTLEKPGFQISRDGAAYCEIWLRANVPSRAPLNEQNVTLPNVPLGALVGVIRFDAAGSDRRGQPIPAGVYTLRYA